MKTNPQNRGNLGQSARVRSLYGRVSGRFLAVTACVLLCGVASCSGPAKVDYARPYPAKAQSESIGVQLRRDETAVTVTNTSARSFPESTLWLNAQYARPLPALGVGETVSFDLATFRNEYSESFRAGGFFATERPDTIVLAQIELESEFVGLVVVKGKP